MRQALKLFSQKGFNATSTSDICLAAKMTKPSLYHYFESKNHLLFSIHMRAIRDLLHPYIQQVKSIEDPDVRIRTIIREYTKSICSHPELRFILHGSLQTKDKYSDEIRKEWKKHYVMLRDTIVELQSAGKINKRLNPSETTLLLLGMITWITFWFDYKRKDTAEEIAELAVELALHGLGFGRDFSKT